MALDRVVLVGIVAPGPPFYSGPVLDGYRLHVQFIDGIESEAEMAEFVRASGQRSSDECSSDSATLHPR